jgi:hypothetical protein
MTPYQRKIVQGFMQLGISGVVASASVYFAAWDKLLEQLGVDNLPVKIIAGLLIMLAWMTAFYYLWWLRQSDGLSESDAVYIRVAALRAMDRHLRALVRLDSRVFYVGRPEDNAIRKLLQERQHVLVLGEPLAGKSRTALEAVVASIDPKVYVMYFTNAEKLTQDLIGKLVVPGSLWNPWRLPEVLLFIDDLAQFATKPFRDLLSYFASRLHTFGCLPRVVLATTKRRFTANNGSLTRSQTKSHLVHLRRNSQTSFTSGDGVNRASRFPTIGPARLYSGGMQCSAPIADCQSITDG